MELRAADIVAGSDLLIFDFDGTLADSEALLVEMVQRSIAEAGLATVLAGHEIARLIGLPLATVLATASGKPAAEVGELVRLYRRRADSDETIARFRLFPGVRETLETLAGAGKRLTIATSKNRAVTRRIVDAIGLAPLIAEVVGGDSVARGKPHPEAVEQLLAQFACPPGRAAVVGDTTFDIEMGQQAGARTIAVAYGMHDRETLAALRPDAIIAESRELAG